MGTKTLGSQTPPPDTTHNVSTTTDAQWHSDTSLTMPEDGYVDTVRVYSGANNGGSSTFKGCIWGTGNTLIGAGSAISYGTGYGFNIFGWPSNGLLFLAAGTNFVGGFQASGQGSQLALLHDSGHYWVQESQSSPVNFSGIKDKYGTFGGVAWFITYFPAASITSIPTTPVAVGTVFTVKGKSFSAGVTGVTVNGVNRPTFTVVDDTTLNVTLANGATTGPVVVATNAGTATSAQSLQVGSIYTDNASSWQSGLVIFADDGTNWQQLQIFADDGTQWWQIG